MTITCIRRPEEIGYRTKAVVDAGSYASPKSKYIHAAVSNT